LPRVFRREEKKRKVARFFKERSRYSPTGLHDGLKRKGGSGKRETRLISPSPRERKRKRTARTRAQEIDPLLKVGQLGRGGKEGFFVSRGEREEKKHLPAFKKIRLPTDRGGGEKGRGGAFPNFLRSKEGRKKKAARLSNTRPSRLFFGGGKRERRDALHRLYRGEGKKKEVFKISRGNRSKFSQRFRWWMLTKEKEG